jgi:hypothetical protein
LYNKSSLSQINTLSLAVEKAECVQPSEQIFVLDSSQLQEIIESAIEQATEPLQARISHLEDNIDIMYGLLSKKRSHRPTTTERANRIKEIMVRRSTISFAELRGILNCKKDSLKRAIRFFLEQNEGYGIIEGSDKRSSLLVKIRS